MRFLKALGNGFIYTVGFFVITAIVLTTLTLFINFMASVMGTGLAMFVFLFLIIITLFTFVSYGGLD
jgi:hypothetical protein